MVRIFNKYKCYYRPYKSILSLEMYNRITRELTKEIKDPNYDIYMIDYIDTKQDDIISCPLIYADQEIGYVYVEKNTRTIKDINIKEGYEHWFDNLDDIIDKYIGIKIFKPRR